MMILLRRQGLVLATGMALATGTWNCADAGNADEFIETTADAATSPEGTFGDGGTGLDDGPPSVECEEGTKQIYVIGTDKAFYRFYPAELRFERIGSLGCPTTAGTFSMAIDRFGTAFVEFDDGRLYAFDTIRGTCKATAFKPGQTGFNTFGMGFSLNSDDPKDGETLYLAGDALGSLDTKTFDLKLVGSLTYGHTELTSRGNELFGYNISSGVIARLDKNDGKTDLTYRTSAIESHGAFAFAQWGGKFWIFTGRNTSTVTSYSPDTDESEVVLPNTGMLIVGAGSSTCAPTTLPK